MSMNKINNNKMCPPLPELPSVYYEGTGFIVFGDGFNYQAFKNGQYIEFNTYDEHKKLYKLIEINKRVGPWCYGEGDETESETEESETEESETKEETKKPVMIFDFSINEYDTDEDDDDEPAYIQPPYDNKYVNNKVIKYFKDKLFFKRRGESYVFYYVNHKKTVNAKNSEIIINQMFKHFDLCPLTAKNTYIKLIRDFKNKNNTKHINDYHAEDIKFWQNKRKNNKFNPSLIK